MKSFFLELRLSQYVCFGVCLLLMAVIPITRDHRIFGIDLRQDSSAEEEAPVITVGDDGLTLINTSAIGGKVIGYAGPTPVEIQLRDDKIVKIKVLDNRETPEYLGAVLNSDMLDSYYGMTLEQAMAHRPDAVSGATYSSTAIDRNVHLGVAYALEGDRLADAAASRNAAKPGAKFIVTIIIILAGALVPLFFKNKFYRYVQLALNVLVLGFWGGTFICYSQMVSYMANGITSVVMIPVVLMLVTAFIYPMFGKADHYCNWLCPYGAIQELAGKVPLKKLRISGRAVKILTVVREALWFALMWLLWTGLWFDWMGYEPFAAFFFLEASPVVLGIAGGFLILSFFVNRPYCRVVCPTGSLFKFSEGRR